MFSPRAPNPFVIPRDTLIAKINADVLKVITDETHRIGYATFSNVLQAFCCQKGIFGVEQLGPGLTPLCIPCLKFLWEMQSKVDKFILAFLGMRSIATLQDLEVELIAMLKSFCMPTLSQFEPRSSNPEEIDLDEDESTPSNQECVVKTFSNFGLGSLLRHPLVLTNFAPPAHLTSVPACSASDIFPVLLRYARGAAPGRPAPATVDPAAFAAHLAAELGVTHLAERGVRICLAPGALEEELVVARRLPLRPPPCILQSPPPPCVIF